jgi:hypothetical protein
MQQLRRDVAVAAGEKEMGERDALTRRPQACLAQDLGDVRQRELGWRSRWDRRRPMHPSDHLR